MFRDGWSLGTAIFFHKMPSKTSPQYSINGFLLVLGTLTAQGVGFKHSSIALSRSPKRKIAKGKKPVEATAMQKQALHEVGMLLQKGMQ